MLPGVTVVAPLMCRIQPALLIGGDEKGYGRAASRGPRPACRPPPWRPCAVLGVPAEDLHAAQGPLPDPIEEQRHRRVAGIGQHEYLAEDLLVAHPVDEGGREDGRGLGTL